MRHLIRIASFIRKIYWFIFRPKTFGVKAILFDKNEKVLLIKNSYDKRFMFPGGGIKRNETPEQAAKRELWEETGIVAQEIKQIGEYTSSAEYKKDTIYFYYVPEYSQAKQTKSPEIDKIGFYSLSELPQPLSESTKRRLTNFNPNKFEKGEW